MHYSIKGRSKKLRTTVQSTTQGKDDEEYQGKGHGVLYTVVRESLPHNDT